MHRVLAVVVVVVSSWAAHAQPAAAQAEVLFRQGRELLSEGKTAEACTAFEESQKLEPAVTTLLNLAGCREKLGQIATAWGIFLDAARQTRSAGDAAAQQLHDLAQARASKIESRVSKLTISVPLQSQFDGLDISRGADRVDPGLWNRALPLDGGTYTIKARTAGTNEWSTQITIAAENDIKTVQIPDLRNLPRDLEKAKTSPSRTVVSAPSAVVVTEAADVPEVPRRRSSSLAPFIVGGGALALLGCGLALELWAESSYDTAKAEVTSQSHRDSHYDSANTKRYIAEAAVLGGLVAGGAAVWLYLHGSAREHVTVTNGSVRVAPTVSGVVVFGYF